MKKLIYTSSRSTEMENIDKMINCGDPSFGGAMYGCPHCGKLKFVPFRCHSRFCPTCGNKYSMARTTSMSFKLVNVQHRHCVFTIDENLRDFFLEDRTLLDCLFHSVTSVVSRMFFKMNKSKNYTPGFIMVLHTFGRDLKWNPHIHCLISEGGYSDDGFWRPVHHFNYTYLRNAFRTALLDEMGRRLGSSFKKVKSQCYTNHKRRLLRLCKTKQVWPWNGHKIHWTLSWTASYCHIQNWQLWWGLGNSHISLQPSWRWQIYSGNNPCIRFHQAFDPTHTGETL